MYMNQKLNPMIEQELKDYDIDKLYRNKTHDSRRSFNMLN
jgi:hypothetical protein